MYKVFYNEKALTLTDKPYKVSKNLQFETESQFAEALALLRNSNTENVNIYHHNVEMLWNKFLKYFKYLEAAGGLVINKENKILFIHRLDKWDLPKGKLEPGETTEIAAIREVEEECGITGLELTKFLLKTYHIYYQEGLILKATYWYQMLYFGEEKLIPQTEEGIGIAEWIDRNQIPQILLNTYENIKIVLDYSNLDA